MRPFTDKQIELVQNFATQAVIAIENTRLLNELRQSVEQQTATSEVLSVISSSPGALQPVFDTMLENGLRICEAKFGLLFRFDGTRFHPAAGVGTPPEYAEFIKQRGAFVPVPGSRLDQVMQIKQVSHTTDHAADAIPGPAARLGGARSTVCVPMLKDEELIGTFVIYRQEVRPFTDKQIALLQNFAAQAVIAIENARLLNELRQRTTDLGEALEQQTATSDVLRVISSSPGVLEPVFQAMLENAVRICDAKFGIMWRYDNEAFDPVALFGTPEALAEFVRQRGSFQPSAGTALDLILRTKDVVRISDAMTEPALATARRGGARSLIIVPMLKDNALIGAITIYRQEVRPFTDKQVELIKNFAAQAVIAIENTRLLNELKQSLEQQMATAEVLRVISSSPGELEPVFQTMLENATRICEARFGSLYLYERGGLRIKAMHNAPPAFAEAIALRDQREPILRPGPLSGLTRLIETKQTVHISDYSKDAAYKKREPEAVRIVELANARAVLNVPMLKEDELIGVIVIYRQEVRPFTDKQIALVQNFAAQAVIAIENTRLLNELRERTNQLEEQSQEVVKLNQQLEQRVADQVGEIERMGRLRRFLPPQVADLIVASGTEKQLESHRREITALFCDLRGFTGFSESADPEDVMALLRDYHAAIGEIVIKYGGTLERFAGDGVMVIFNDPVAVENPALQAVLMALDMRTAIGTMIEKWRDLGHDLGFGIGIAHGFATLGTIGFEGRFDYAAIGTVSNVASRLCDEAKPGQILISPRVRLAVDKAVTIEAVGEFTLKGIRRPMTAYNVLAASPSAN